MNLTRSLLIALSLQPLAISGLRLHREQYESMMVPLRERNLVEFLPVGQDLFGTPGSKFGSAVEVNSGTASMPLLAVGAPSYDLNVSVQGFEYQITDAGAVFVYEQQPNEQWDLVLFLPGLDEEELGDRLALSSSDYRRIAVRRHQPSSAVEVYNIAPMGAMPTTTRVGSPITGSADGDTVAISADGTRVAVSSETYSTNTGIVQVMDFNDSTEEWEETGRLMGDSANDQFGWRVAFSNSGDRLAVSARNYNSDGMARRGLVRVFDYDTSSSSWVQIGNDLVGEAQDHQFGSSMDLSGDGRTVAVGAPRHDGGANSTPRGVVAVFGLFGGNWVQKGDDLVGINDGDRLGSSVAISEDGTRVAASSSRHNDERGHVIVWDWVDVEWIMVKEIEGDVADDQVGYGFQGISLSNDGDILTYGAVNVQDTLDTGFVQVVSEVPPSPSSAPSLFPSSSPTGMLTPEPSYVPSAAPVIIAWTIERDGPAEISFSEAMLLEEVKINYIISNRDSNVSVFEMDCMTAVPSSVVEINATYTQTSSRQGNLSVGLDIIQDTVVNSNIWSMIANDIGHIDLCVRIDLLLDDEDRTSVNFRETVLSIDIDLNQGFNVSGIDSFADDPDFISKNTTVDFSISACQCNAGSECINERVGQDSDLFICLSIDEEGVGFSNVTEMDFIQNDIVLSSIDDGVPNSITTVTIDGSNSIIQTRLVSSFFDNPSTVTVEGVAVMTFFNGSRRNLLQASRETNLGFGLSLELIESSAFNARSLFSLAGSITTVSLTTLILSLL